MAFSVETLQGVAPYRTLGPREFFFLPGDPGVTYTRGEMCALTGGVLVAATDGDTDCPFTVERTVVCPAASQVFPKPADLVPPKYGLDEASKTLVLVSVSLPAGAPVRKAKIANYQDETVVTYSASSRYIECTTGFGADDRPNGALAYVYEGPGAGEFNIVEDYVHTGGATELNLVFHRPFSATLTTSSKFIVLAETTAANAVSMFSRADLKDKDELDVNDGVDDGDHLILAGWRELRHIAAGHAPIVNANLLF